MLHCLVHLLFSLLLVFVNCYDDWKFVQGTIVDVRDIVTLIMHYIMLHLVFVYTGLNCASLSVVLVFEAEQFYSQIISWGCRRIMRIERIIHVHDVIFYWLNCKIKFRIIVVLLQLVWFIVNIFHNLFKGSN